ncbi:hypothetical protein F5Y07DRAFT_382921 [Xylaria sp. FL0933]|nr:hypothetical protein F5Y07DRAFT_382921 [Xylaria sp. FL0933]
MSSRLHLDRHAVSCDTRPVTPSSQIETVIGKTDDSSKRSRPTLSHQSQLADASRQGDLIGDRSSAVENRKRA